MIDASWLQAFAMTLAIEVPLVVALAPRGMRHRFAVVAVAAQAWTHPLAWIAVVDGHLGWWTVEAGVVVLESIVYAAAGGLRWRAAATSLLANGASAMAGLAFLSS